MNFSNRTVIVTGGGGGIGRAVAAAYAGQGANVVVADIDAESGERVAAEIGIEGNKAIFVRTDLRREQDVVRLMRTAADTFGRIDILINNAGISRWKSPYELTADDWDDVLNTNLRGSFFCAREAAKTMRAVGGGSIVNIASTRALMSEPNSEAYAASKGGLVALTHALAVSFGKDGIRVNCISPGWIETKHYEGLRPEDHAQHPAGRVGTPEDIARACLFLTDPDNGFVTGAHLVVDGGMTRKMIYLE